MTTDFELVKRVQSGETQAFARLIERYERSVLAVVQAELRDPDLAQDVTKDTLLLAFRRLGKLDDGSRFGPWLLRLARRRSIDAVRRMPVAVGGPSELEESHGVTDGCCDPDWIDHEHLLGLVARLPDEARRLVGLRYFDNHSEQKIAELVGSPIDHVKRQMSLAMMRLQYWWTREQEL